MGKPYNLELVPKTISNSIRQPDYYGQKSKLPNFMFEGVQFSTTL